MTRPSELPTTRTCCMCGARMVEVRRKDSDPMRQDWQCPRCLHTERTDWEPDGGVYSYDRLTKESED